MMAAKRRASRDLAQQMAAVRAFAAQVPITLDEAVDAVSMRMPNVEATNFDADRESDLLLKRLLYKPEDLRKQTAWAKSLRAETGEVVLRALELADKLGALRHLPTVGSSVEMEQLRHDFPNFTEVVDFVWGRALLCRLTPSAVMRLPPILLDGPPGTGKTAFCERLATWLRVPIQHIDMTTMDTSFKVTGLDAGYATGKPGLVWEALQDRCMAPVMVLDELDKRSTATNDSGLAFLLGLLEPSTAARYKDACIGLPVDASRIMWLATSNDAAVIDAPLLSRFRIFRIAAPMQDQMRAVVASVYRVLRRAEDWAQAFPETLPEDVVERLQGRTPREVRQAIEDACVRAAAARRCTISAEDVLRPARPARRPIGFLP